MFDGFSHYLAYGATDQRTARDLLGSYDGLVVPGTVAAFQREGTGGFVLSLSATEAAPSYVIDSRFPLFQQALVAPKKSHEALAALLGDQGLISSTPPAPADFDAARTEVIVRSWVSFNRGYREDVRRKFDKYAARLGEAIDPTSTQGPEYVVAPYVIAEAPNSAWWQVSEQMYEQTHAMAPSALRVVATETPAGLDALLRSITDQRVLVWVSGLEELVRSAAELGAYARAIRDAARRGLAPFALYGGFFHVLLGGVGLRGASHGIGYGEYRAWVELPQSGPPPARYYLRRLHRYVSQELAYQLYLRDRSLVECNCDECHATICSPKGSGCLKPRPISKSTTSSFCS